MAVTTPSIPLPPAPIRAAKRYLACSSCGYGVSIARTEPPRCPMFGSSAWLPERRQPPRFRGEVEAQGVGSRVS
jgi:hypothetical protein